MRIFRRLIRPIALALTLTALLAACDNAESRAERHYASAIELVAAGDVDRALVELRNVFRLNGAHREARRLYAELQRDRGEEQDAYANFLRLVEFYPEDLEARVALTEMAVLAREWEEAERHGRLAAELDAAAPEVRALLVALEYRMVRQSGDTVAQEALVAEAEALLAGLPGALSARMVVIDHRMARGSPAEALAEIDRALAHAPDRRDLHDLRLRTLSAAGDDAAVAGQLGEMIALFPEETALRDTLLAFHLDRDRMDLAEAFLRDLAAARPGERWAPLALIELIRREHGADAALAEIAAQQVAGGDALLLGMTRARLDRAEGRIEAAIAELEALVASVPASDGRRDAEVLLAQMLQATGAAAAAQARVASVLEADDSHVDALKMQATWAIEADRPADAVLLLRRALAQEPRDSAIMMLMAEAHLRDGSRELAGERLALAVEVSNRGAREALRYAEFLVGQGRLSTAEALLEDALRVNAGDLRVLAALTELRLDRGDLERTARGIWQIRAFDTPEARRIADTLQAALLARQDRTEETLELLESLVARGDGDLSAVAQILMGHFSRGEPEAAAAYLDGLLADFPEEPTLRFMRAGLHILAEEEDAAEAIYRTLADERPGAEGPVLALYALYTGRGDADAASALVAEALAAAPDSVSLRWMQAGELEAAGDYEGAIALYEALYAENSANPVFANNLASLLSTRRADAESLDRAFAIARRLRATDVPAFRGTYGWIEFRRGNHAEALGHLQLAAEAMPDAPLVQLQLGLAYAALERTAPARETLTQALALAEGSDLPQIAEARAALAALPSETSGAESGQ